MSTTTTVITPEQIIAEVRKVAAERPDHVYRNPEWPESQTRGFCKYMHDGEPGCIMGTAFYHLGVTLPEGGDVGNVLMGYFPSIYDQLSEEQESWLRSVQRNQDQGSSWADAVIKADEDDPLG